MKLQNKGYKGQVYTLDNRLRKAMQSMELQGDVVNIINVAKGTTPLKLRKSKLSNR
jgi:hypothetical protein